LNYGASARGSHVYEKLELIAMNSFVSLLLVFLLVLPAPAQTLTARKLELTVDQMARGPELYGNAPRAVRWSRDGQRVYFQWKRASDPLDKDYDTYVVGRDGSGLLKLSEEDSRLAPPLNDHETKDHQRVVYTDRGDLFIYDRATDRRRQLTKTSDTESNPRWTKDNKRVAFVRGGNLYTLALEDGMVEQWTDIRPAGAAPAAAPAAGMGGGGGRGGAGAAQTAERAAEQRGTESQESLKKEERALLDIVERRAKKREEDEARRKKENPRKPWTLAPRQTATNLQLSPDESYVLATVIEQPADVKNTAVPSYVTESAYTESLPSRSKVGDSQGRSRMAMVKTATGEVTYLDHGLKQKAGEKEVDRVVSLQNPQWSEDGRLALLGRAFDNKDRWVFAADTATGKLKVLFHLHDDAWVNGPGSFSLGWLPDQSGVYFQAERTGWSHLYSTPWSGGEVKALTSGKWEVESAELSQDQKSWWLTTSEESLHERHFYTMPTAGGARTKVTSKPGDYSVTVSPDGRRLAVVYSYTNRPPELYLMDNRPGAEMRRVTESPAPEFSSYPWLDTPIVKIPARDGAEVPAHLYKPNAWKPGGPAVIFVHGAGYLQNVTRGWSSYAHEYLFHHLLMERGFLVIDIDYRGSAGYGRDWRAGIYDFMGGKDLDDHVDAARWLVKQHGVDPRRIGLYGGSYGGFITLMAMFTQPDVFAAGAALRPVTDWAHYNHGYTANILNVPQKDLEAYRKSSPIYHAAGLNGALLICHGVVDVNVHFQDSVRLAQKLIELRKENWELAMYPVEDHGFVQPSSWADEYKRILKLFETNLKK
jgi:dipeptidyl aminopeptidase/acylaminoacyl peptidase